MLLTERIWRNYFRRFKDQLDQTDINTNHKNNFQNTPIAIKAAVSTFREREDEMEDRLTKSKKVYLPLIAPGTNFEL